MATPQNFRSAFNGFNREDVAHYLEFLNNRHVSEMNQLREEAERLRQQLAAFDPVEIAALRQQCADLEVQLDAANAEADAAMQRSAQLEQTLDAIHEKAEQQIAALEQEKTEAQLGAEQRIAVLEQELAAARQERDSAKEQHTAFQASAMQELEAYRRAERAERMAKERAEQVYHQTRGVLDSATEKVDDASKQITGVSENVMAQLNLLQCAVSSSRLALQEAAAIMDSLRPEPEEE